LGKYEVLSDLKNFRGSAIGILQECLRSCVTYRKAEINYYLGLVYKKLQQPMKAFEYFQSSYQLYKDKVYHPFGCPGDKKKVIKSFIEEYYDINKFEYIIRRKAKAVQQAVKENKDVQIKDETLESLISA
jgi:tetratricopeptide (TPR) repeat protein